MKQDHSCTCSRPEFQTSEFSDAGEQACDATSTAILIPHQCHRLWSSWRLNMALIATESRACRLGQGVTAGRASQ